jgi:preprotein translocase subunit SecG
MDTVLLVIQLMLAVALIVVILFQRTAQDGGGLTGGSSTMGGLFTARGSANLLTRTTAVLATLFILNSLALGYLASSAHRPGSIVDQINVPDQKSPDQKPPETAPPAAAQPAPQKPPEVPLGQ